MTCKIFTSTHVDNFLKNQELLKPYKMTADLAHLMRVLASYDRGGGIYPGMDTIAQHCFASTNTIRRRVQKLKSMGLLNITLRPGQSSTYEFTVPNSPNYQEKLSTTPPKLRGYPSQISMLPLPKLWETIKTKH